MSRDADACCSAALQQPRTSEQLRALYELIQPGSVGPQNHPHFIDFAHYLSKKIMDIKMLIDAGFADVCALAFLLGGGCLSKKEVGLLDGKFVQVKFEMGLGKSIGEITDHHLRFFPFLNHCPAPWLTTNHASPNEHEYSLADTTIFDKLDENKLFVHRSYFIFLKFIATPKEKIPAALFEIIFFLNPGKPI